MPVLLYGCENWVVTEGLLSKLEKCLAGMVKRALKWPRHLSSTAAVTVLDVPSVRSRLLVKKLGYLKRVLVDDAVGVGAAVMRSMVDDAEELCLVKECRELEEGFGTNFVDELLCGDAEFVSMKEVKERIAVLDREKRCEKCREKAPLIAEVEEGGGWLQLWSYALDLGQRHTRGLQALTRMKSSWKGSKAVPMV